MSHTRGVVIAVAVCFLFGPAVTGAHASSGVAGDSSVRAKIPRLTLSASAVRHGGEPRVLQATFAVKERFRYRSYGHLRAIERYYEPRNVRIRFMGRTYRLEALGTLLPEMIWAFSVKTKRPNLLRCKIGSHPRATLKYRNRKGSYSRKIRVGCRG